MSLLNERIVYNADKASHNVCHVKSAGHVSPDPTWVALREDSHDVMIVYIADGKAKLTVSGGDYPLYRGDCIVFPPRKYTKMQSDAKNPPDVYWLRVSGELVEFLIKCYFPNMRGIIATCDVENYFARISDMITRPARETADTVTLLIHKLLLTIKNSLSTSPSVKGKNGGASNKYEEYIITHMYDKLDVHEFADHFGMSVAALTGVLKRKFGKTPYQYYLSVKMDLAKNMLSSGKTSVDDIAERLCFTDRTHFSKLFKRETGLSPAAFRAQNGVR